MTGFPQVIKPTDTSNIRHILSTGLNSGVLLRVGILNRLNENVILSNLVLAFLAE